MTIPLASQNVIDWWIDYLIDWLIGWLNNLLINSVKVINDSSCEILLMHWQMDCFYLEFNLQIWLNCTPQLAHLKSELYDFLLCTQIVSPGRVINWIHMHRTNLRVFDMHAWCFLWMVNPISPPLMALWGNGKLTWLIVIFLYVKVHVVIYKLIVQHNGHICRWTWAPLSDWRWYIKMWVFPYFEYPCMRTSPPNCQDHNAWCNIKRTSKQKASIRW